MGRREREQRRVLRLAAGEGTMAADDAELHLVGDQPVGDREQLPEGSGGGRRVEDRDCPAGPGRREGRRGHLLGDLELGHDHVRRRGRGHGRRGVRRGEGRVGAGMMMIRLVPSGSTQMGATPLEPGTRSTADASMP